MAKSKNKKSVLNIIGNILWVLFVGLIPAIVLALAGGILCITIIGIPLGKQFFKIARYVLLPFGKNVSINFKSHPILNIIWVIFFGWETAIWFLIVGLILYIFVITIPAGKVCINIAKLVAFPFGAKVSK